MTRSRPDRRLLLVGLGLAWLVSGGLQLQPQLRTQAFFGGLFESATISLPSWLAGAEVHLDTVVSARPTAWDLVFSVLELSLGVALVSRRAVRVTLAISFAWSVGVWVFGEGLGGLTLSGANALTGAPGPAALYALASLLLWPRGPDRGPAVADSGLLGAIGSKLVWASLWIGTAALWLEYQSHMAGGPGGLLSGVGNGEPAWISSINHAVGGAVGDNGPALAALLGAAQLLAGAGVLVGPLRRPALGLGAVLAAAYGIFGQDLGALFTGQATEPGTGPILIILAASLWPRTRGSDIPPVPAARNGTAAQRMMPVWPRE